MTSERTWEPGDPAALPPIPEGPLEHYRVQLEPSTEPGRVMARIMPYGQVIQHRGARHSYSRGSLEVGELVPVTLDHGNGVLERIGRLVRADDRPDALYGELQLSDTAAGRDTRTLLLDGVITDVSAGVDIDRARSSESGGIWQLAGRLDHIAIVGRGAFAGPRGSRVLAAYMMEDNPVPDSETLESTPAPEYVTREDYSRLERQLAELATPSPTPAPITRPGGFRSLHEFIMVQRAAQYGGDPRAAQRMEAYRAEVQAQLDSLGEYVLDDETTTTAAGLVPDYLSNEIIGLINDFRPFVDSVPSDPIGDHGMSVVYPKVVVKPDVGIQAAEKTEVTSQAMDIDPFSVDLVTYAGATDVSLQLVERSQPSFVDRLFAELAGVYAERTDAASIAAAVAAAVAAGNTAVVANFGTDASATWAAIAAGAADIAASVKRPADTLWIAADRFGQLITLTDSEGRPLLTPRGTNAMGTGDFTTFEYDLGGLRVIVDPHAAAGTALLGWRGSVATLELSPQQLRAVQVDLLGLNVGVWGLFATVVKYPTGLYAITAA